MREICLSDSVTGSNYLQNVFFGWTAECVVDSLRFRALSNMLHQDAVYFDTPSRSTAITVTRLSTDAPNIKGVRLFLKDNAIESSFAAYWRWKERGKLKWVKRRREPRLIASLLFRVEHHGGRQVSSLPSVLHSATTPAPSLYFTTTSVTGREMRSTKVGLSTVYHAYSIYSVTIADLFHCVVSFFPIVAQNRSTWIAILSYKSLFSAHYISFNKRVTTNT